ncbi:MULTISPECIES: hypothetical protein [Aliarcobacter]|nr:MULTISPECIES: hypothetical protein [Aliarcobacter]MCG3674104.1 hypothetical protein [Aliarcobacter butzleri]MCT7511728.1 hypothetical protein [Aliarcobacter cryaerophilus]
MVIKEGSLKEPFKAPKSFGLFLSFIDRMLFMSHCKIANNHGRVKHGLEDWTSSEIVRDKIFPVYLSYESMEESPIIRTNLT